MNPSHSLGEQKRLFRQELRQRLEALSSEERLSRSERILKKLFSHPKFIRARSLLTYLALPTEVETGPILEEARKEEKKVYAPRVDQNQKRIWMIEIHKREELSRGPYGILEPPFEPSWVGNPKDLDLAVVPGLGFDREGGRLGRGEGYFDRFLKEAKKAYKIGLAFECQRVEKIPQEASDVGVDEVLFG